MVQGAELRDRVPLLPEPSVESTLHFLKPLDQVRIVVEPIRIKPEHNRIIPEFGISVVEVEHDHQYDDSLKAFDEVDHSHCETASRKGTAALP